MWKRYKAVPSTKVQRVNCLFQSSPLTAGIFLMCFVSTWLQTCWFCHQTWTMLLNGNWSMRFAGHFRNVFPVSSFFYYRVSNESFVSFLLFRNSYISVTKPSLQYYSKLPYFMRDSKLKFWSLKLRIHRAMMRTIVKGMVAEKIKNLSKVWSTNIFSTFARWHLLMWASDALKCGYDSVDLAAWPRLVMASVFQWNSLLGLQS